MSDQPMPHQEWEWENLLKAAMQGRPEILWGGADGADLAAAAIERARLHGLAALRLQRIGRWVRMCSAAAAVLLLIVFTAAVWSESRLGASSAVQQTVAQASSSASNASDLQLAGALLLLMVIGGTLVRGILSGERGPADLEKLAPLG